MSDLRRAADEAITALGGAIAPLQKLQASIERISMRVAELEHNARIVSKES